MKWSYLGDWVSVSQAAVLLETQFMLLFRNVVSLCVGSGEAFRELDHLLEKPLAKTNKLAGRAKYGHNSH